MTGSQYLAEALRECRRHARFLRSGDSHAGAGRNGPPRHRRRNDARREIGGLHGRRIRPSRASARRLHVADHRRGQSCGGFARSVPRLLAGGRDHGRAVRQIPASARLSGDQRLPAVRAGDEVQRSDRDGRTAARSAEPGVSRGDRPAVPVPSIWNWPDISARPSTARATCRHPCIPLFNRIPPFRTAAEPRVRRGGGPPAANGGTAHPGRGRRRRVVRCAQTKSSNWPKNSTFPWPRRSTPRERSSRTIGFRSASPASIRATAPIRPWPRPISFSSSAARPAAK